MTETQRVTVTVPTELLEKIKEQVAAGYAPSVSAWIADVMRAKATEREFAELLDEWLEESGGPPTPEERAWAREALWGSSSTPEP